MRRSDRPNASGGSALFAVFAAGLAVAVAAPANAGVALCQYYLGDGKGLGNTDTSYELLNDPLRDSMALEYSLRHEIRTEHGRKTRLSCVRGGRDAGGFNYVVGRTDTGKGKDRRIVFSMGVGKSDADARRDLAKTLAGRDWSWNEKRHGLEVLESGNYIEPDRSDPCYKLVRYRDRGLAKDVNEQIKILGRSERILEIFERVEGQVVSQQSWSKFQRRLEALTRAVNAVAAFISSYTPQSAAVYHGGTMMHETLRTLNKIEGDLDVVKGVKGEAIAGGKLVAGVITKSSAPVGYALATKVANIEAAVNIVNAAKSHKDWVESYKDVQDELARTRTKIEGLRDAIKNSSERLDVINQIKNAIDETCNRNQSRLD